MLKKLTFSAVCVALAIVLSQLNLFTMPQGGSVTLCSRLFIVLVAYWYGPAAGFAAGIAQGLLTLFFGASIIHPAQFALDYVLSYGALGLAGFFRKMKRGLAIGYIAGCAGQFLCNFLAGAIFYAQYAPEGQNVLIYSAVYNLSYLLPEMALTLVIISIPAVRSVLDRIK
ncbi:MAG: energy-coupled thiamine transporter ThiT [Clostridiales bacterium]|nr:energy-coupled thiamine transporter ThiT [Clostridiales bacterium]